MIKYHSTNKQIINRTFQEALFEGQAPDKGLYMPDTIPKFSNNELNELKNKSFADISVSVLSKFLLPEINKQQLNLIIRSSLNFDLPLEQLTRQIFILRLDQGPTASFKDIGARTMARLMQYYLKKNNRSVTILTATSGDTGSAVASAFYGLENIKVILLFPEKEVTEVQRKQMTTLGKNIVSIAVQGKFDDCQAIVKQAFADPDLETLNLTSANSINIARLLPQTTYYFYAYLTLANAGTNKIIFSVPSGNFGNLTAGLIAKKMGLTKSFFISATNSNNSFVKFIKTQQYQPISPSLDCISNAMNVGNPSNIARIFELYNGRITEKAKILKQPNLEQLKKDLTAYSITDSETLKAIQTCYEKYHTIIEPHGAVAFAAAEQYLKQTKNLKLKDFKLIILETAHPEKFKDTVENTLKIKLPLKSRFSNIYNKKEYIFRLKPEYDTIKKFLLENI
ncbi:MAG: threonine synthase [Patescibacteria group bacterium]|nr:MAG: threonine synthase [Patescibacteria group bacterium]